MAIKETTKMADTRDFRIRKLRNFIHLKVEKYVAMVRVKEGRILTKEAAAEELLDKATRHIKITE